MTVIVGIAEAGELWIGGDSRSFCDGMSLQAAEPKVWHSNGVYIGAAGSSHLCDMVRYLDLPPIAGTPPARYLATKLAPALREALGPCDDGYELGLLVGLCGRIFTLDSFLSPASHGDFAAVGSGERYALTALEMIERHGIDMTPEERVLEALRVASRDAYVGAPFDIVTTTRTRRKRYAR